MAAKTKTKGKAAKGVEVEVVETPAPKAKAAPITFGAKELAELINEKQGTDIDAYRVRVLLRKLVKDEVIDRGEAEARSRYSWPKGEKDPEVKAILAAVKGGALERAQTERKESLKEANTAKRSSKKAAKVVEVDEDEADEAPAPKSKKAKAAPAKAAPTKSRSKSKAKAADLDMDDI